MKTFVEPQREVMRRSAMNNGLVSLRHSEGKLLSAARELTAEGYLTERETFPCGGAHYTRFAVTDRVDMQALKDI